MDALLLAAVLFTADATVRESEDFALAGQLAMFPHPALVERDKDFARQHLAWLTNRFEMGPLASDITQDDIDAQSRVILVYTTLQSARWYSASSFVAPDAEQSDNDDRPDDPWDYLAFCRRQVSDNVTWLKERMGTEAFIFGRLPAPLPCMEPR